jgi:hypothetical protein
MQNPSFSHRRVPAHLENDFNPPSPAPPVPHVSLGLVTGRMWHRVNMNRRTKPRRWGLQAGTGRSIKGITGWERVGTVRVLPSVILYPKAMKNLKKLLSPNLVDFPWFSPRLWLILVSCFSLAMYYGCFSRGHTIIPLLPTSLPPRLHYLFCSTIKSYSYFLENSTSFHESAIAGSLWSNQKRGKSPIISKHL